MCNLTSLIGILGGQLYIDFVDDEKWDKNMENLVTTILKLIKPRIPFENGVTGGSNNSPPPSILDSNTKASNEIEDKAPSSPLVTVTNTNKESNQSEDTKPLSSLTYAEVGILLISLDLEDYQSHFLKKKISGELLECIESPEELQGEHFGISVLPQARRFFKKLTAFKSTGVPIDLITNKKIENSNKESPEVINSSLNQINDDILRVEKEKDSSLVTKTY